MRVLLDTHAFLWFIDGNPGISRRARAAIEDPGTEPFLSVASVWEIAIKMSLGKLTLDAPLETFIPAELHRNGIALLGISITHTARVAVLPFHHRDPFDRLLVAQAQIEQMPILTVDPAFAAYAVDQLW